MLLDSLNSNCTILGFLVCILIKVPGALEHEKRIKVISKSSDSPKKFVFQINHIYLQTLENKG